MKVRFVQKSKLLLGGGTGGGRGGGNNSLRNFGKIKKTEKNASRAGGRKEQVEPPSQLQGGHLINQPRYNCTITDAFVSLSFNIVNLKLH